MFNHNASGYNLSDIAAVTGANNRGGAFGDGDQWWIILLFLFAGWGGNGWGNGGGATTREEIAYGFDINGLENGVRGIQQGLCDGFYAMNTGMLNGFAGVTSAVSNGVAAIHSDINDANIGNMQNTYALTNAITTGNNAIGAQLTALATQASECCCGTQRLLEKGFSDLNYNLATQACDTRRAISDSTRDIIDSNNAGVRSILDFLTQDKIATLQAENQSLKFAASQAAQNAYLVGKLSDPNPVPAYVVPSPYQVYGPGVCCNSAC